MRNEVTNFMYYMYNRFSLAESKCIYGDLLGEHIYNKYIDCLNKDLGELRFYAELDNVCRRKLVDRANEIYG